MLMILWTLVAFLCGAIPFSVLIGRFALGKNIRQYGDRNPGATNVLRAGGKQWGGLALMLDISKGAAPVGLAWFALGLSGWALAPIALAPPLGHGYSPFLRFQGGKAIASIFGCWIGLLLWEAGIILLIFGLLYALLKADGWVVILTMSLFLGYLVLTSAATYLLAICVGHILFLVWKHRTELGTLKLRAFS